MWCALRCCSVRGSRVEGLWTIHGRHHPFLHGDAVPIPRGLRQLASMAIHPETTHSALRAPAYTAARVTLYGWAAALIVYGLLIFTGFVAGQGARVLTNAAWTI